MPGTRVRLRRPEHMPLCRASTSCLPLSSKKDVDGRDKPGHDEKAENTDVCSLTPTVHFFVPADHVDRLFRAGPAQSFGSGDMAGAGLAGVLLGEQLAVRAAAPGLGRVQLCHRRAVDLETAAPASRAAALTIGVAGDLL